MDPLHSQDAFLYKKCKQRVSRKLFLTFAFLILYCVGVYIGFDIALLQVDSNGFTILLATVLLVQLCIYSILFLLLASGSKIYRILYWFAFLFSVILIYVPVSSMLQDTEHFLSYILLIICMLCKLNVLYHFGHYLYRNPCAKVLYDHVIEVDENGQFQDKRFEKDIRKAQKKLNKKPQTLPDTFTDMDSEIPIMDMDENPNEELFIPKDPYEGLTYQKLSIRLGLIVYVSLGLFPILVQIFHSLFVSTDYQQIFANRDIFIACMVSAIIWTLPVFFLYYNHPKSKLSVKCCGAIELARILIYLPTFIGYFRLEDTSYPLRTFLFFILLDMIRYFFLFRTIYPIFKIAQPEPVNDDDQYD